MYASVSYAKSNAAPRFWIMEEEEEEDQVGDVKCFLCLLSTDTRRRW